jgi:heat shock protein beta
MVNSRWWSLLLLVVCVLSPLAVAQEASSPVNKETDDSATPPGFEPLDTSKVEGEKFQFETQVNRLMKLIINSLYKSKDIFLRELISVRFLGFLWPFF